MIYTPVTIDGVDIKNAYGFYLVDRHLTNPATKTDYIDIPDMHGSIDATELLGLFYEDRILSLKFIYPELQTWDTDFSALSNYLHGKKRKIIFADDPSYYYIGRIFIDEFSGPERTVTGSARVYPYKLAITETVVTSSGNETVTLTNGSMPVVPEITTTAQVTLAWGTNSVTLSAGTYRVAGLELEEGETELTITGSANVTIKYRQGRL